jgi:hypothetical protein
MASIPQKAIKKLAYLPTSVTSARREFPMSIIDRTTETASDEVAGAEVTAAPVATPAVKLTVALPPEAVQAVENIAAASHKTKTQVLREAIALKAFIESELSQPGTRLLIERGGSTREIVFT